MRILGIDPGSRKAGLGLVDLNGNKFQYFHSETLKFDTKKDF